MLKFNSRHAIFTLVVIAFLLTACSKDDKKTSTQVAAKVDGAEISLHQINQVLKSTKDVSVENAALVKQQILDRLIDQQIIVDKAEKEKLDRTPDVMMAVEAAKKDILARAYLQKMVADSIKISDGDVKKYYEDHPALFSKRRVYSLQDIGVEKNDQTIELLNAELNKQKTMQEIADVLKNQNIKFSAGAYTRPAEQIPLEILPQLQLLEDGKSALLNVANSTHLIKVVKSQDAPIALTAATPFIRNYFMNTKGKQLVEDEMKKYRTAAKIEYMGDFSRTAGVGKQATDTSLPPVVKPLPSEDGAKKSSMEEGISGLK